MRLITALLLSVCAFQQTDAVRDLIQKLRSDKIEEREDAERKLLAIGSPAIPELEKVARDADREVAQRASHLVRLITLSGTLSPRLLRTIPGIEDQLATGDDHAYTVALLVAAYEKENQ